MRISDHCYAVTGLGYLPPWTVNAGFVVGQNLTLIVDTGGSKISAATIHGYAQAARPGNAMTVINTEKHLDHILGNCFFRDLGIDVYGHPGISRSPADLEAEIEEHNAIISDAERRRLREGRLLFSGTRVCNPNKTVTPPTEFELGGLEVQVVATPGHTPTNLTVWVPSERVAYSGDCVVNGYSPNLQSCSPDDWKTWLQSLDTLRSLGPEVVVPGHGPVLRGPEIDREAARVRAILREACAAGGR
jgi:glyoxylase-like metal-dependent hydrolase (beta-lactamase superfamily II)